MNKLSRYDLIAILSILITAILFISGIKWAPFHPDESTQIFMSSDVEIFLDTPSSLFFQTTQDQLRQHYRLVDAPLTRTIIGIGRLLTSSDALESDWDWSLTWDQNDQIGALPSTKLLMASRMSVSILMIPALYFFYLSVKKLTNNYFLALLGLLLIFINPLILLHTRRAMAESVLFFTVCLNLWLIIKESKEPISLAAGASLAFLAKQTAAVYIIINLWVALRNGIQSMKPGAILRNVAVYTVSVIFIILVFNPVFWKNSFTAISSSIRERNATTYAQEQVFQEAAPGLVLHGFGDRISAIVANQFFMPPAIAEVPNYILNTHEQFEAYFSRTFHRQNHLIIIGAIQFGLGLFGFMLAIMEQVKNRNQYLITTDIAILSIIQLFFLLVVLRFPFQRYVLPLIPINALWCLFALDRIISGITAASRKVA